MIEIQEPPWVISLGMCTPLGLDAPTNLVEAAAGTTKFVELEDIVDRRGEPVVASSMPVLADQARTERIVALGRRAASEALERAGRLGLGACDLPVFVGLPEPAPHEPAIDLAPIQADLQDVAAGFRLRFAPGWACQHGRAGFFVALERAIAALDGAEVALVGGVDSLCDRLSIRRLVDAGRIRGGLLPGEGAGFIMLARADRWARQQAGAFCVLATSLARHEGESGVDVGRALAGVFRALRRHPRLADRRCHHVLTCQTGESHLAAEFGVAYVRNGPLFPEPMTYDFVGESFGDCGAASGALAMGLAQRAFMVPHVVQGSGADQARILVYASSDGGDVGACVVGSGPIRADLGGLAVAHVVAVGRGRVQALSGETERDVGHYEGHLEDVEGLLNERRFDLETGATPWSACDDLLAKIGRHLDALRLGGECAYGVAHAALSERESPIEMASMGLLCGRGALLVDLQAVREGLRVRLGEVRSLRFDDDSWRAVLLRDAVRLGDHPDLDAMLWGLVVDAECSPAVRCGALDLACWRRRLDGDALARLIEDGGAPLSLRAAACLAMARMGGQARSAAIVTFAATERQLPDIVEALLRLRVPNSLELLRWIVKQAMPEPMHLRLLGVAGDPSDLPALLAWLVRADESPMLAAAACDAMGSLGLVDAIDPLIDAWGRQPELLCGAALALERITGAGLPTSEVLDDDEETEEAAGSMIPALYRLCREPEAWRRWWADHRPSFAAGQRMRAGRPLRADACLVELESEGPVPRLSRELAALELSIRSGTPSEFEADAPADRQKRALAWWRGHAGTVSRA